MKKEEQIPVDEFFRKREADIPVTFDPKHWEQLAEALDRASRPEPLPPSISSPKAFRGSKGWWVSGVWILALLTSAWVLWQRSDAVSAVSKEIFQEKQNTPAAPTQTGPARTLSLPSVSGAAEKTGAVQPHQTDNASALGKAVENAEERNLEQQHEVAPGVDSIKTMLPVSPATVPADTATAVKRKKKHLFW